jgi:hypothetical protein
MLTLLSAIVALACVVASGRRLAWVVGPTGLDPTALLGAMQVEGGASLAARLASGPPGADWERELLAASVETSPAARDAIADEQLLELRWRLRRWERVPRVCASIATSAGFLFASIVLLQGLAAPVTGVPTARETLFDAMTPLAVGIAGTAFCVAVHLRVRRLLPRRLAAYDRLIDAARGQASG